MNEYLSTTYSPDREYVDGLIVERNLGEIPHSDVERKLIRILVGPQIESWPEQRVQISPSRFRVPDVCVTLGVPSERIITSPPLICIEILSPEDSLSDLQDRIDDYLAFGVPYIWLIDPLKRLAYTCDRDGIHEARTGALAIAEPPVCIALQNLFD